MEMIMNKEDELEIRIIVGQEIDINKTTIKIRIVITIALVQIMHEE